MRRIFIVVLLINVWNILKKTFELCMMAHCLTGDKKTWLLILAKSFIMQAFGKSFPFSLPFNVNGKHPRQNSDRDNIPTHIPLPDRKSHIRVKLVFSVKGKRRPLRAVHTDTAQMCICIRTSSPVWCKVISGRRCVLNRHASALSHCFHLEGKLASAQQAGAAESTLRG